MFEFALLWAWLLLPVPWLIRTWTPPAQAPQAALTLPKAARFISPRQNQQPQNIHLWGLPVLCWLALVTALAQPQWVGEPIPVDQERREMIIALDLSGSMEADDMTLNGRQATRLQVAHSILAEFIERRQGDRIGLVVYADDAYLYSPLTSDLNALSQLVREARLGLAGQRTALGDAIALSISYLQEQEQEADTATPVVLMLTDGMINSGAIDAEEALTIAASSRVRMHTIGIGADEMIVQGLFGQRRINPSAELDEVFLTRLAESSGGEYFRARNEEEMRRIYTLIDELEPVLADDQQLQPRTSLAHWPLLLGFLALVLHLLLGAWRSGRRVEVS